MYNHILVTLDGSPLSEAVLPHVQKLAAGTPVRVTLLTVAEDTHPITSTPRAEPERFIDAAGSLQAAALQEIDVHREGETREQAILRIKDELAHYLEERAAPLRREGIDTACEVALGDPVQAIIERARAVNADAIAMATHGRTGLSQLLLGSVASRVIERSRLPVILVRPVSLHS